MTDSKQPRGLRRVDAERGSPAAPVSGGYARARGALLSLAAGNFVIGTGAMIVAGLMNVMSADLHTSVAAIGQLIAGYGCAVCFGAPILASLTSRYGRRQLLVSALALYAIGHILVALAPSYPLIFALRVFSGFGAAIFTPQAAATAGLLVPAQQRGSAVSLVFIGFSVANVLGTPIGIGLGGVFGWRLTMLLIGLVAAGCALALIPQLPAALHVPPIARSAWREVRGDRALLRVLATTFLQSAAQFVLIAYLAAVFHASLGAGPAQIGLLFAWVGAFGVLGNLGAGLLMDRLGALQVARLTMVLMLAGLLLWPLTYGSLAATLSALGLWGLGSFAANSAQQARLIALRPSLAPVSVALNSSNFYLGQAAGAALGGVLLESAGMGALSWAGVLLMACALALAASNAQPAPAARTWAPRTSC